MKNREFLRSVLETCLKTITKGKKSHRSKLPMWIWYEFVEQARKFRHLSNSTNVALNTPWRKENVENNNLLKIFKEDLPNDLKSK